MFLIKTDVMMILTKESFDEVNAGSFFAAITAAMKGNQNAAFVDIYTTDEYSRFRLFLADDGKVGFAINGEEIVSVFKNRESSESGVIQPIADKAVAEGGKKLVAFEGYLTDEYGKSGFQHEESIEWNDDYMPKDWDSEKMGKPNLWVMRWPMGLLHGEVAISASGLVYRGLFKFGEEIEAPIFPEDDSAAEKLMFGLRYGDLPLLKHKNAETKTNRAH